MRKLINFLNIFFVLGLATSAQCDVKILDFNGETGDLSIEVVSSENCGCNEYTSPGTTCESSASPTVQNNETINHFVYGLHLEGDASPWTECVDNINHDGFTFKSNAIYFNELESGDVHNVNLWDIFEVSNECWEEILQYAEDNQVCAELVIWQINLSQTANTYDFPGIGWTPFDNPNGTQEYPDPYIVDNRILYCPNALVYPGCTDPIALNYDPEATEDNGTCVYSIGPDLIIIDINIINTYCNSLDYPVYQYQATVVNIGTEPVTYFCLDDFLSTTSYQCYNGIANPNVYVAPLDTITVGGSLQVSNGWVSGQMNFMSIESVPGEIITGNNNFVFQMPAGLDCSEEPEPEPCDTVYIDVPIYITDTLYVDNYIYVTDTIFEYITEYITEYVTDTVYEYLTEYITDTLYITETEYIVDTLYITEYVTDTIYITETEYLTDTLYITEFITDTLFIDNYIYLTDTITEYIVQELWIDCETGLPCTEDPPGLDCPDWTTIHAPNTFTPNSDGINDVWKLIYDLGCWEDVEFWIYNRWGNEIYHAEGDSFDSYPYWDGSVQGGSHYVSDGVYVYTFRGKKVGRADVIQESGHITVFR